ncbi:MAG: GTPase Era [Candidatus Dasytiphilus stammeri]
MEKPQLYCGYVPLVGRSNVGKSTLLNYIVGKKISIVCPKQQTTRQCITGIYTQENHQTIFIDTPGLNHRSPKKSINHLINCNITNSIKDNVALIIFVVAGTYWTSDDNKMLKILSESNAPVLLVINKIDLIKNKKLLLPHIYFLSKQMKFIDILPISAHTGYNINILVNIIKNFLPKSNHLFPKNRITNQSVKFMISEIIREKLMLFLNREIPYSVAVNIDQTYINKQGYYNIFGYIIVERKGQKNIIIGYKGNRINTILKKARHEIELMMNTQVSINLWIKIKDKWADNRIMIETLGY